MTTFDILTRVNECIHAIDDRFTLRNTLDALATDLEAQLRREKTTSRGELSALRVVTKILSDAKKSGRPSLGYASIDAEGRQCIVDGFQAYRLRNHLPLEERPADAGEPLDLTKIFPPVTSEYKRVKMPSAKEIRAFIAVQRAKIPRAERKHYGVVWYFGEDGPAVNAEYLLNAATIFPNATELFWRTLVSPLVIMCDEGDGLLMPVRVNNRPAANTEAAAEHDDAPANEAQAEESERSETIPAANTEAAAEAETPAANTEAAAEAEMPAAEAAAEAEHDDAPANEAQAEDSERSETIPDAFRDARIAFTNALAAEMAACEALKKAAAAKDAAAMEAAFNARYDAREAKARARMAAYAADPEHRALDMEQAEKIVRDLYARQDEAASRTEYIRQACA